MRNAIEKYLYQQAVKPKRLALSDSLIVKRYEGVVNPSIEFLNIDSVLSRVNINYSPEEAPWEQPYIDQRLLPYMQTTKLPLPVIEIYKGRIDNARPHLPSGERPYSDIYIEDGAHRIVALKKLGFTEVPFVVYREPERD